MPELRHVATRFPKGMTLEEYFWEHVDKNGPIPQAHPNLGPCWNWTGNITNKGYGRICYQGQFIQAHVFAWRLLIDPEIKDFVKAQRDHLCKNRRCVNPKHMEEVTRRENILRGDAPTAINARKTICENGHDDWVTRPNGTRRCRECHRISANDAYAKKKAQGAHPGVSPTAINAAKTHCKYGHLITGVKKNGKGRYCKECANQHK